MQVIYTIGIAAMVSIALYVGYLNTSLTIAESSVKELKTVEAVMRQDATVKAIEKGLDDIIYREDSSYEDVNVSVGSFVLEL